jgi:thiamine pyrophosphate-dependent acetolactate synthase large subunit-like protein
LQKAIISKLKSNQREDLDAAVAEMMASKFYFLEVMVEKENNVFPRSQQEHRTFGCPKIV